jgi:hypothetical protein
MSSVMLVLVSGAMACGVALALALAEPVQTAALWGAGVATFFGLAALLYKARSTESLGVGAAAVKELLSSQVVTLGLRVTAVLLGGFAVKQRGLEPIAYVLAFFGCYVAQQFIEMRFVLAENKRLAGTSVERSTEPERPSAEVKS